MRLSSKKKHTNIILRIVKSSRCLQRLGNKKEQKYGKAWQIGFLKSEREIIIVVRLT